MEKRAILAIVIATIILIAYPYFLAIVYPPAPPSMPTEGTSTLASSAPEPIHAAVPRKAVSYEYNGEHAFFETAALEMAFQKNSLNLDTLSLKEIKDPQTGEATQLITSPVYAPAPFTLRLMVEGKELFLNDPRNYIETASMPGSLRVETITPSNIKVYKEIYPGETPHTLEAAFTVINGSAAARRIQVSIIGTGNFPSKSGSGRRFSELKTKVVDKLLRQRTYGRAIKENYYQGAVQWVAAQDQYFSQVMVPRFETDGVTLRTGKNGIMEGTVSAKEVFLQPGESFEAQALFYFGATSDDELSALGLSEVAYVGKFTAASRVVIKFLRALYAVTHNYGLALILLASIINVGLYPLTTRRSLESARKMQAIQPKIQKLREKYPNDAQKLNKEMMAIYKEHKINPLSGCLPMLLQMPIFFALFTGLVRSIELRGASFLWIKDLSMPDKAFTLPFTLPILGNAVNLLPVGMCVAMFLQQRLSAASTAGSGDKQQQQMMMMMPIMFGFIFYNFASGLVLYWLTGTLWMVGLQTAFHRQR